MGSADIFCLQWNTTIRSNLREIRETSEFFDVTLCCDNGVDTVKAHKVIMAACSPLFRRILVQNNHQNPFLLLKGIHFKELQNVLNSMYYGEVSIAQDSLNKFLTVAEELAVKGLTTMDTNHIPTTFYNGNDSIDTPPKQSSSALKTKNSVNTSKRKIDPDLIDKSWLEVDLKRIKAKPEKDTREGHQTRTRIWWRRRFGWLNGVWIWTGSIIDKQSRQRLCNWRSSVCQNPERQSVIIWLAQAQLQDEEEEAELACLGVPARNQIQVFGDFSDYGVPHHV